MISSLEEIGSQQEWSEKCANNLNQRLNVMSIVICKDFALVSAARVAQNAAQFSWIFINKIYDRLIVHFIVLVSPIYHCISFEFNEVVYQHINQKGTIRKQESIVMAIKFVSIQSTYSEPRQKEVVTHPHAIFMFPRFRQCQNIFKRFIAEQGTTQSP